MKKFSRRHFVHASAGLATATALTGCGSNTHSFSPGSNSSAMPGDSGTVSYTHLTLPTNREV
mgnify:CR=1 FL=1